MFQAKRNVASNLNYVKNFNKPIFNYNISVEQVKPEFMTEYLQAT